MPAFSETIKNLLLLVKLPKLVKAIDTSTDVKRLLLTGVER